MAPQCRGHGVYFGAYRLHESQKVATTVRFWVSQFIWIMCTSHTSTKSSIVVRVGNSTAMSTLSGCVEIVLWVKPSHRQNCTQRNNNKCFIRYTIDGIQQAGRRATKCLSCASRLYTNHVQINNTRQPLPLPSFSSSSLLHTHQPFIHFDFIVHRIF